MSVDENAKSIAQRTAEAIVDENGLDECYDGSFDDAKRLTAMRVAAAIAEETAPLHVKIACWATELRDLYRTVDGLRARIAKLECLGVLIEEYANLRARLGTEDGIAEDQPELWKQMLEKRARIFATLNGSE